MAGPSRNRRATSRVTRPLRRASLRQSRVLSGAIDKRRAQFERVAQHYINAHRSRPARSVQSFAQLTPTSLRVNPDSDPHSTDPDSRTSRSPNSAPLKYPPLTPEFVLQALDGDDEDSLNNIGSLLHRLQTIPNEPDESEPDSPSQQDLLDEDDDMRGLAELLATDRFLSHESDRIQLLTACCITEIFRIFAPEPPLDDRKLDEVCTLFIDQLSVLVSVKDDMEAFRFSLLEQLATIKIFVIFCDNHAVVCDLFSCFYAICRPHQTAKVQQYFVDILSAVLEEMEHVQSEVLDTLLAPLIPALQYSASAVSIAEMVVRQSAKHIQLPLCNLLNESIRASRIDKTHVPIPRKGDHIRRKSPMKKVTDNSSIDVNGLSTHHAYISDIIIAISRVEPDVLIYVLPNLEPRVRSEDLAVRRSALSLLSRLFTTRVEMITSYPSLFMEFLNRRSDQDGHIREIVASSLGDLLLLDSKYTDELDAILYERLHDLSENVRIAALSATAKAVDVVSDKTLNRLISRLQDKVESVGKEAFGHIVSLLTSIPKPVPNDVNVPSGSEDPLKIGPNNSQSQVALKDDEESTVILEHDRFQRLENRILRLSEAPKSLLSGILLLRRSGQYDRANSMERGIFEKICFPATKINDEMALERGLRRAALFFSFLTENGFVYFSTIVLEKSRARNLLLKIAELRLTGRTSLGTGRSQSSSEDRRENPKNRSKDSDFIQMSRGNIEEARAASELLVALFPRVPSELSEVLESCRTLATAVDLKIYDRFIKALDCNLSSSEITEAASDAVSRLGSKSRAGVFFSDYLFPKCRPGIFSSICFSSMCKLAIKIGPESRHKEQNAKEEENESGGRCSTSTQLMLGMARFFKLPGKYFTDSLAAETGVIIRMITLPISSGDWSAEVVISGLKLACDVPKKCQVQFDRVDVWKVLESLIFADSPISIQYASQLSKWASRLVLQLSELECAHVPDGARFSEMLTARLDDFHGDLAGLVGPMTALSQVAKHSPSIFKAIALKCFDFARALLSGYLNAKIQMWIVKMDSEQKRPSVKKGQSTSGDNVVLMTIGRGETENVFCEISNLERFCAAEVASTASKVLVYGLDHVDPDEEFENVISILVEIMEKKSGDAFDICSDEMPIVVSPLKRNAYNDANAPKDSDAETCSFLRNCEHAMRSIVRLCAGKAFLVLARHEKFCRKISPKFMVVAMLTSQDENSTVRICFARSVWASILKKRLPLRWVACFALMAVDPVPENAERVHSMTVQVFRQRRNMCEALKREGKAYVTGMLPESTLADLIWVLANLPGVEVEEEAGFPESEKCLELLLDCLLEAKEYANVINEYIETVSIAEDATDFGPHQNTKSNRLKELSRIASELLRKKMIRRKWELLEHVPQIKLPQDLFRLVPEQRAESGTALRPTLLDVAKRYDKRKGIANDPPVEDQHYGAHEQLNAKRKAEIVNEKAKWKRERHNGSERSMESEVVEVNGKGLRHQTLRRITGGMKRPSSELDSAASRDETVIDNGEKHSADMPRENGGEHSNPTINDDDDVIEVVAEDSRGKAKASRISSRITRSKGNDDTHSELVKESKRSSKANRSRMQLGHTEIRKSTRLRSKKW